LITPKLDVPTAVPGFGYWAWFHTLKNSVRKESLHPGFLGLQISLLRRGAQQAVEPKLNLFSLSHRMLFVDFLEKLEGLLFLTVF
jgi:hypothetical protein